MIKSVCVTPMLPGNKDEISHAFNAFQTGPQRLHLGERMMGVLDFDLFDPLLPLLLWI